MKHSEGAFPGVGGLELYYQKWLPEGSPLAILAIVHGFGEHSGRYGTVVNHLTSRGFAIYGFDHRGHGRSPGQRGHINAWDEYRGDVNAFLKTIQAQNPQEAIFLMGTAWAPSSSWITYCAVPKSWPERLLAVRR